MLPLGQIHPHHRIATSSPLQAQGFVGVTTVDAPLVLPSARSNGMPSPSFLQGSGLDPDRPTLPLELQGAGMTAQVSPGGACHLHLGRGGLQKALLPSFPSPGAWLLPSSASARMLHSCCHGVASPGVYVTLHRGYPLDLETRKGRAK